MFTVHHYSGRFQTVRGGVRGLPAWARVILTVIALPAVVALALSILAVVVSLSALLLLTAPVYLLLRAIAAPPARPEEAGDQTLVSAPPTTSFDDLFGGGGGTRRRVEAKVIDSQPAEPDVRAEPANPSSE